MILPHHGKWPHIHETAFVAPSCDVIGEVSIGASSSIWFQCVIRGDVNAIQVGTRTNIQDHSMLHVTRKIAPLKVGDEVTVGHRVLLHGCTIGNRVLVGMGAVVMDLAEIGEDSIVGAGALVTKGKKFPPRSLIIGSPAVRSREVTDEEVAMIKKSADNYVGDATEYRRDIRGPERLGQLQTDLEKLEHMENGDESDW